MSVLVDPGAERRVEACGVRSIPSISLPLLVLPAAGCWTGSYAKENADAQVYPMLENVAGQVTGQRKVFKLERPVDTLRARLLAADEAIQLSLVEALDVAAENSRDFQRQKELLYLAALNLTRSQYDFSVRWGGGGAAEVSGVGDDTAQVRISDDLGAAVNSVAGTRLVVGFVNTFLRSIVNGGAFDGSSILNLTLTQPLLRGAGAKIVREPLTQTERDLVYQMRTFERFRATFAVQIVSEYYSIVRQMRDLRNLDANYQSLQQSRLQTQDFVAAGRRTINDLGRELQSELSADSRRVLAEARLQTALDRFKILLGLPTTARVTLDPAELDRLGERGVRQLDAESADLVALALQRRYDHRTIIDQVEDAGRRVVVSEDALRMNLDFSAALNVPSPDGSSLNLDWSRVNWRAGFDLDLALDRFVERNAYRSALIALDAQIRSRENSEDQIAAAVRNAVFNIRAAYNTYQIEVEALRLAETRVESTTELYAAGRVTALDVIDAKASLLASQLSLTAATVEYAISRLELLRDIEGIALEPQGLRFDPGLPMPQLASAQGQP